VCRPEGLLVRDGRRWYAEAMGKSGSHDLAAGRDVPFGTRLRGLREAAGLTQEELAESAGLSVRAIRSLERGERKRPYPHTVRSLADALGLPEDERALLLAAVPGRGAPDGVATPRSPTFPPLLRLCWAAIENSGR
jgi:transcriptional regulator with XRE-family HTH domain